MRIKKPIQIPRAQAELVKSALNKAAETVGTRDFRLYCNLKHFSRYFDNKLRRAKIYE